jgi:aryl-alcohol dehydrogenase-like predicted oxidoreductase
MSDQTDSASQCRRRDFLQAGAMATASALTMAAGSRPAPLAAQSPPGVLPTRKLGATGADVTILNLGTWMSPGLNRLLRFAYASGVRCFDTAESYGSEPGIAAWLQDVPQVRSQIFLVTKDHPNTPDELIAQLDQRLAVLQVDYVDLFLIHALGPDYGSRALEWPRSQAVRSTVEAIKQSGKARFVGFSTHDANRADYLEAAAEGGFIDAIMLQYNPWIDKSDALNRALDACWDAGIGLISMKQVAGHSGSLLQEFQQQAPDLAAKGLTPYQALLQAIWSDERIATCCVSMRNLDQIRENAQAAATFQPLKQAEIDQLRDACLAAGPTFCAGCDGRCARAAGTAAALGDLTRLLTYHDQYGYRGEARRLYAQLPEALRNWQGADLEAARRACPNGLDFATLLPRAERHLT